jgi:hypothetical protein
MKHLMKHFPLVLKNHYDCSDLLLEKLYDFVEISASFCLRPVLSVANINVPIRK